MGREAEAVDLDTRRLEGLLRFEILDAGGRARPGGEGIRRVRALEGRAAGQDRTGRAPSPGGSKNMQKQGLALY